MQSSSKQRPFWHLNDFLLTGDGFKRSKTHKYVHDCFNLAALLQFCSFTDLFICSFDSGALENWHLLRFDMDVAANEYKPESQYLEASRSFAEVEG